MHTDFIYNENINNVLFLLYKKINAEIKENMKNIISSSIISNFYTSEIIEDIDFINMNIFNSTNYDNIYYNYDELDDT